MPQHDLPLILVTRHLDGGVHVGEVLLFPEVVALHAQPHRLQEQLRALARKVLSGDSPADVHRRLAGVTPQVSRLPLTHEPPRNSLAWSQPITLRFDVLRWRHGDEAWIGYVPVLGIEVVAHREDQLDELFAKHVRTALARTRVAERLFDLAQVDRVESVSVSPESVTVDIATPTQLAAAGGRDAEKAKPVIEGVGIVLNDGNTSPAYEIDPLVDRLVDALVGRVHRSVLLVGPSGVGKTAAVHELSRQRRRRRWVETPFWSTSGARLIAGMSGYGMWQERCQKLCREARAAGAILHLGNLIELTEVGKAGGSPFGVADFFRPYLGRGDVLAVAECTPEQLPLIERANPQLLSVFHTLHVEEPTPEACKTILLKAAVEFCDRHTPRADGADGVETPVDDVALETLARLHRRYATYSASPGRPLRFLRNLLLDHVARTPATALLSSHDVTAAFSRETGLPLFLLDDATRLDPPASREHFASRVVGQPDAVDLIVDLLVTVKASLNRPRRPIASLLFAGPTGVGKTEMAKALADYFFGGSDGGPLVRFDMSEYGSPAAVARLVGTAWEREGLLTGKVREQPFCVVLLDEFEKAHPCFFDLLLQMLGDGRLTDSAGRLADFSNAIVVMTSNLGGQDFGAGPFGLARATTDGASRARIHFTDAVREFLRPELFNRIDRVVPFLPLARETIERIAAREIDLIARRDGVLRRDVQLDVSPDAIGHLARAGYDPLYGARPLKRRIEQDLLTPLADAINPYAPTTPLEARVDVRDRQLHVEVRARKSARITRPDDAAPLPPASLHSPSSTAALAQGAASLRRRVQALVRSPANLTLQNELFTLNRLVARKAAHPGRRFIDPNHRERVKRLQAIADDLNTLTRDVNAIEDALLLNLYENAPLPYPTAEAAAGLVAHEATAADVLLELLSLGYPEPHAITLAFFGASAPDLFALVSAYRDAAAKGGRGESDRTTSSVSVSYYTRLGKSKLRRTFVARDETDEFLATPRPGVLGIVLGITAPFARARFETDGGLHVFQEERDRNPHPFWVDASPDSPADYAPPKDVEFRVALAGQRRRTYTFDRKEADDTATGRTYRWAGKSMCDAIAAATAERLKARSEAILQG